MNTTSLRSRNALFSLLILLNISFLSCHSESDQDVKIAQNQQIDKVRNLLINHGKVVIKLEPHGSIRASVFQDQTPIYEFILNREKKQTLLTGTIDKADIYLTGEHQDGLVIDDLLTGKRYVLSCYDISKRLHDIPTVQPELVFIRGYAINLLPETNSVAFNLY